MLDDLLRSVAFSEDLLLGAFRCLMEACLCCCAKAVLAGEPAEAVGDALRSSDSLP